MASPTTQPKVTASCLLNRPLSPCLQCAMPLQDCPNVLSSSTRRSHAPSSRESPPISLRSIFMLGISTDTNLVSFGKKIADQIWLRHPNLAVCFLAGHFTSRKCIFFICSGDNNDTGNGFCRSEIKSLVLCLGPSHCSARPPTAV